MISFRKCGASRLPEDIEKGHFDCSGLIYAMLRSNGIMWGIGITDTLVKQGKRVPKTGLQVGDLIFFDSYKKF
ncbi:NlpC/P60 family protein [Peribacillus butanolivorans]|uniref:NlpC/P60 family protein n=1 Tax=Peribacillus butanolivorans TaxID=421767 RepID=UPI0036A7BB9D